MEILQSCTKPSISLCKYMYSILNWYKLSVVICLWLIVYHIFYIPVVFSVQWRHNGREGISNHQPHDCLSDRLFRCRSKKTSKLCVTGLCAGNSPVTGEFPAQMTSKAESVSIWWRHHVFRYLACHIFVCGLEISWLFAGSPFNITMSFYQYRKFYYSNEMVFWPSDHYNENIYNQKDYLYIETWL